MIKRLYVHNFRCFENFEFKVGDMSSALLIGKNGAGKSTVAATLRLLQSIGRGVNRAKELVIEKDFSCGRTSVPIRFEIEVLLGNDSYFYSLAFELPENFKELRVLDERLEVAGKTIYSRNQAQVTLPSNAPERGGAKFSVDWHLIALPIIQEQSKTDPLKIFKSWLAKMVILAPIPSHMSSNSTDETLMPDADGSNLGDWLSGLLSQYPAAYSTINDYLVSVMRDIQEFRNEPVAKDAKRMVVIFASEKAQLQLSFDDLSDGEKCFFLCAVILAANKAYGPLFCFWDEPDNYLSLSEVGSFIVALRKAFNNGGQIIVTSHNEEAIRKFSSDNTWVLDRKNHLEPTLIRLLADLPKREDLIQALILGDITL
jgi:energy-coupling factor transporter ATP-binding protein EcfA2